MKILSDKMIKTLMMSLMGMVFFFALPLYSAETGADASTSTDTVKFVEFEKILLGIYEAKISSGNPVTAARFLDNDSFKEKYLLIDREKASLLIAKSQAVVDLNKVFDFVWNEDNFNKLSDALGERINDKDNILCSMGFGPQPEKLIPWVKKHRADYKEENILIVKKAIREWDIMFSTSVNSIAVDWAQARGGNQKTITKEEWNKWNIRQRNAAVDKLLPTEGWKNYAQLIDYSEETGDMIRQYCEKDKVVKDVEVFLSTGQQSQLDGLVASGASLDDQMFFLGQLFNGDSIKGAGTPADAGQIEVLRAKVNSFRDSFAREDISPEQNDLLNDMVQTSVMTNIRDTVVGARLSAFYGKNKLDLELAPSDSNGSYDPKTGKISIDSGLVREFMRVKGYTPESIMANQEQLDEVAKFVSPTFVHQAGFQMQDVWAKKNGVYKPLNQEDKINASSMEAIYTLEKIKKDKKFRGIFKDFSKISDDSYASKVTQNAKLYAEEGNTQFASTMSNLHYGDLPSMQAASSKIIYAINNEIERRDALSKEKKAEVEDMAYIGKGESYSMGSRELLSSLGFIDRGSLIRINDNLLATDYDEHYQSVNANNNFTFFVSKAKVKVEGFISKISGSVPPLVGVN